MSSDPLEPSHSYSGDVISVPDAFGAMHSVRRSHMIFRPSAYALCERTRADGIVETLLIRSAINGQLFLPGGGIRVGDSELSTVIREVQEESGYTVRPARSPYHCEPFLVYVPANKKLKDPVALHVFALCYEVEFEDDPFGEALAGDPDEGFPEWHVATRIQERSCNPAAWRAIRAHMDLKAQRREQLMLQEMRR